jgi:hypothetical protein
MVVGHSSSPEANISSGRLAESEAFRADRGACSTAGRRCGGALPGRTTETHFQAAPPGRATRPRYSLALLAARPSITRRLPAPPTAIRTIHTTHQPQYCPHPHHPQHSTAPRTIHSADCTTGHPHHRPAPSTPLAGTTHRPQCRLHHGPSTPPTRTTDPPHAPLSPVPHRIITETKETCT